MICKARLAFKHSNSSVKIISHNLGRQLVENSLFDLDHLEFNQCILSLAIHRQVGACVSSGTSHCKFWSVEAVASRTTSDPSQLDEGITRFFNVG